MKLSLNILEREKGGYNIIVSRKDNKGDDWKKIKIVNISIDGEDVKIYNYANSEVK